MLATDKLIILVIGLVVLVAMLYLLYTGGKGSADQLLLQNDLRICCGGYRAIECVYSLRSSICCENHVSGAPCNPDKLLNVVAGKLDLNEESLARFCGCTTVQ
jgi:hypothetical protein